MTEKEAVTLMKEWKDEIKGFTKDYHEAIIALKKESEKYNQNWFNRNKELINPTVVAFLVIIVLVILSYTGNWCTFEMFNVKITRSCSQSIIDKKV